MSDDLADIYTDELHRNLKQYAAWPVDSLLQLGDYGILEGRRFKRIGNIKSDFKIRCIAAKSPVNLIFDYKSSGVAVTNVKAGVTAGPSGTSTTANAKTALSFKDSNSIYFRSIRQTYSRVDNFAAVGKALMKAFSAGDWPGSYLFVHDLFTSKGTTIVVSSSSGAEIEIEAGARAVEQIDLADANAKLSVTREVNVGLQVLASDKLVPLFGLAGVRPRFRWLPFLGGRTVKPLLTARPEEDSLNAPLPGHVLANMNPEISPETAKDLGKKAEELFQVQEIP
jgi:hypothetical protein